MTNKVDERYISPALATDAELSTALGGKVDKVAGKGLSTEDFTTTEKTKLSNVQSNATQNDTDANLKNRANHTGTQLADTISNFSAAVIASALTGLSVVTGGAIISTDSIVQAFGKIQKQISDLQTSKYDASNPNNFETPFQLNSRDNANRSRTNHSGTQLASTISDLATAILATTLTGLSTATGGAVISTDSILAAFGKAQKQMNDHFGAGGSVHAVVTQLANGFMIASDKIKLDNALGRFTYRLSSTAVAANTTFTAVGEEYIWIQSRHTLVKSLTIIYYAVYTNRSLEFRLVNVDTGTVLATSSTIAATGYGSLSVSTLPTTDCRIGLQVRRTATGGSSPTVDSQLEFQTI